MNDYSNFPFAELTVAQTFALARESRDLHDEDFVKACMEAIRLNKCADSEGKPHTAGAIGETQERAE